MAETRSSAAPMAGRRRTAARLAAVQALYQIEITGAAPTQVIRDFLRHPLAGDAEIETVGNLHQRLFVELVEGIAARRLALDAQISAALTPDWPLERLEIIIRSILRAGAFELVAHPETPARVVISEYLDIAHAFFSGKEPGLVNGVLDRLARTLRPESLGLQEDDPDRAPDPPAR